MILHSQSPLLWALRVVDDCSQTNSMYSCTVNKCCSARCKTCRHICQTNVFKSNVTNKVHSVISPNTHMDCGTDNIIYLVSCKKMWCSICW